MDCWGEGSRSLRSVKKSCMGWWALFAMYEECFVVESGIAIFVRKKATLYHHVESRFRNNLKRIKTSFLD